MAELSPLIPGKQINKCQVRRHFSCHAREYDGYAKVQQVVAKHLVAQLKGVKNRWEMGLEVGCGTGLLSQQLLQLQPDLKLVLSDIAHGMSKFVQHSLSQFPVCDADAAALPFLADKFDLLVSSSVYQWLNDLPNAFFEISRVLRPNGTLAIALFGKKTLHELRSSHQSVLCNQNSHVQSFPALENITAALTDDFEILSLHSELETEWHVNVEELLRSLKKIGAQNASQKRPHGFASRQVMQQMIIHYNDVYGCDHGIPATYEVIYLLAQRR